MVRVLGHAEPHQPLPDAGDEVEPGCALVIGHRDRGRSAAVTLARAARRQVVPPCYVMRVGPDDVTGLLEGMIATCDDPKNEQHVDGLQATRWRLMAALTHARVLASGRTDPARLTDVARHLEELSHADSWNLPAATLIQFLIDDFECAWQAIASRADIASRCNFMFAMQAMTLLELVFRACETNRPALRDFATALHAREPRYFSSLPEAVGRGRIETVPFPTVAGVEGRRQLLHAIFELVRHGQAHQYQQMVATLRDGSFGVRLSGADYGSFLDAPTIERRRKELHLQHAVFRSDVVLQVLPEVLFCDIRDAARQARLCERGLTIRHLEARWDGSVHDLTTCFDAMNGR